MSERPKTANYRRCFVTDGQGVDRSGGKHLQSLLAGAAKSVTRPWLRAFGPAGTSHQLLTRLVTKNNCACGELVYYEPGRKIPLVDVEKDGSTWQDTIHPKDATGKQRKFQEQSLYFAVRENHVAIIQSTALQADELQDFLAWFVQEKASLAGDAYIQFKNLPAKSAVEKLKDHQIKAISFGDRLFTSVREPISDAERRSSGTKKRFTQRIETSPTIMGVLRSLGIAQPILDNLQENPDPGSIHVEVEISYRSRKEKEAVSVLHSLADTLGKVDGLETEIKLDGKSSIKNDELTVRGTIMVQCPDGCIAGEDALSKLSRWLMEQIESKKVL